MRRLFIGLKVDLVTIDIDWLRGNPLGQKLVPITGRTCGFGITSTIVCQTDREIVVFESLRV